ncbi:MAG TPA: uroporphyrinogen-III C-methyltransferase [Candidatus Solibacter sp.]|nr:uroporphyrinogen-III C-methyltransferase [Candidatus Solibacter sp.]
MFGNPDSQTRRKVYLVGAGPGDPELLTLKAARALGSADVVLHDALVSAEVLALVSPRAQVLNVGKRCGRKNITQDEVNDLLVRFAAAGEIVVRLKSGDPSIFGRAAEEIDVLRHTGIEVEVIPGVTASLAAAAKIRVSLTDRRRADQLPFVSAHSGYGKQKSDWPALIDGRTTVVVYMPGKYEGVAEDLRRAGLSESTPCAIISKVSNPDEQWYETRLGSLHDAPVLPSPCVLIVGETVRKALSGSSGRSFFRPSLLTGCFPSLLESSPKDDHRLPGNVSCGTLRMPRRWLDRGESCAAFRPPSSYSEEGRAFLPVAGPTVHILR